MAARSSDTIIGGRRTSVTEQNDKTTSYTDDDSDRLISVTDAAGNVTEHAYDTEIELDPETSLYYYRARYYDPTAGRFLSEDPVGFDEGINFYTYVRNRAPSLIDPTGTDALPWPLPVEPPRVVPVIPITLLIGDAWLAQHDWNEFQKLCAAYGWAWCSPQPECKRDKWKCRVRCALIDLRTGSAVGWVEADGFGPTEGDAFYDGQKKLQNSTPRGFRTKHCHVVGRCEKQ